jgi:hypothetical protein
LIPQHLSDLIKPTFMNLISTLIRKTLPTKKLNQKDTKGFWGREKVSHGGGGGHLIPAGHSSQTPA